MKVNDKPQSPIRGMRVQTSPYFNRELVYAQMLDGNGRLRMACFTVRSPEEDESQEDSE